MKKQFRGRPASMLFAIFGLTHNLRHDLIAEKARLELAAEMRGVFVDLGFSLFDAIERGLFIEFLRLALRHAHGALDALLHWYFGERTT